MTTVLNEGRLAQALIDPSSVFTSPSEVVETDSLSIATRVEILRRWEYDAHEFLVADEEGFPVRGSGDSLDAVLVALHRLGTTPDLEHSPPTKHGGI